MTGLSLGVLGMPHAWNRRRKAVLLFAFVVLASVPDYKPLWGFQPNRVRHSLALNLALVAIPVAVLGFWPRARRLVGGWPVVALGAATWLSHLLLDAFYSHGLGVHIGWPFGGYRLNLALPWFDSLKAGWAPDGHTARVVAVETLFYGAVLALCLAGRWWFLKGRRMEPGP